MSQVIVTCLKHLHMSYVFSSVCAACSCSWITRWRLIPQAPPLVMNISNWTVELSEFFLMVMTNTETIQSFLISQLMYKLCTNLLHVQIVSKCLGIIQMGLPPISQVTDGNVPVFIHKFLCLYHILTSFACGWRTENLLSIMYVTPLCNAETPSDVRKISVHSFYPDESSHTRKFLCFTSSEAEPDTHVLFCYISSFSNKT